jgi:hypothetical protein
VTGDNPGDASREAQEAAVRRLCGEDVELYVDWGVSGRGDGSKRPEYRRLKDDVAGGRVTSVCAYSLSRLGRNARELLSFIELCQQEGVPVRTAVESIDTGTAMGRAMLTVMAAFAQLELEQGMERSAAARDARQKRHAALGLATPPSRALYGRKHVTEDGITHVVHDPERPIQPVLDAYREAGTVRGACELLQRRGVLAPSGGKVWGVSTLTRILEGWGAIEARRNGASKTARRPVKPTMLFAGLLFCHCGRRMTPNAARGQYYCAAGRDSGSGQHGRMSVTEAALRPVLEAEADRWSSMGLRYAKAANRQAEQEAKALERRLTNLDVKLDAGRIRPDDYKAEVAELQAELGRHEVAERRLQTIVKERVDFDRPVAEVNALMRKLWWGVKLDENMVPTVDWVRNPEPPEPE